MAANLFSFVRKHPFLIGFIGLIGFLLVSPHLQERQRRAYEASPEGQRQIARKTAQAEQEAAFRLTKSLVQMQLRDPDSAVFSGMRLVEVNGRKVVCGLVNSRNGFGGMSGPMLFVHVTDEPVTGTYILGQGANASKQIERFCGR